MIAFLWIVRIKFLPIENLIIQTAPFIKDRLRILPDIIAIVAQIKKKNFERITRSYICDYNFEIGSENSSIRY